MSVKIKKTIKWLVVIKLILFAALLLTSYFILSRFTGKPQPTEAAVQKTLKYRQRLIDENKAESLTFYADDGVKLSGLLFKRPHAERALLVCHGWWMNKEKMHKIVNLFSNDTIFLFDFRMHGESEGVWSTIGHHEQKDIKAAFELLKKVSPGMPIYGVGVSMGAAALLGVAHSLPFAGLVIESTFRRLDEAIEGRFVHYTGLPIFPFMLLCKKLYHWFLGLGMHEVNTAEWVQRLKIPIFFIHSKMDRLAHYSIAQELHKICSSVKKELWIVEHASHATVYSKHAATFKEKVNRFFDRIEEE